MSWTNLLGLIPIVLSTPWHILLITTIIKYRKTAFNTSYYTMLVSLSIHSLFTFVFSISWKSFALGLDWLHLHPTLMATIFYGLGRGTYKGAQMIIIAIGVNRFINVKFPLKAKVLWRPIHTAIAIGVEWATVSTVMAVHAMPDSRLYFTNQTRVLRGSPIGFWKVDAQRQFIIAKTLSGVNLLCSIMVIVLYAAIFKTLHNAQDKHQISAQKKLAAQGLMLSSLIVTQGFFVVLYRSGIFFMPGLIVALSSANYYLSPLIAFAMSKDLRQQAKLLLGGKPPSVAPKSKTLKTNAQSTRHI